MLVLAVEREPQPCAEWGREVVGDVDGQAAEALVALKFDNAVGAVIKLLGEADPTLPVIVGFAIGGGVGAACEAAAGLWSLAMPTGLAFLAVAMGTWFAGAEPKSP